MIKIIIADDHEIVRIGLKRIIEDQPDMKVTAEASDGNELLQKVREFDFDVILLDIHMPGWNGLEILKQLKHEKKRPPVLVLTIHPEEKYAIRSLKAGASGYLTKATVSEEVVEAIRTIHKGQKYISSSLAVKLADSIANERQGPRHENLSDREYQVICMLASGKTISMISEELSLSVNTVSTYRRRILDKMDLHNNAELTNYAIKNNLIE